MFNIFCGQRAKRNETVSEEDQKASVKKLQALIDEKKEEVDANKLLLRAVEFRNTEVVRFLLETCKADPNHLDEDGDSPLTLVFQKRAKNIDTQNAAIAIAELLLRHGANPFYYAPGKPDDMSRLFGIENEQNRSKCVLDYALVFHTDARVDIVNRILKAVVPPLDIDFLHEHSDVCRIPTPYTRAKFEFSPLPEKNWNVERIHGVVKIKLFSRSNKIIPKFLEFLETQFKGWDSDQQFEISTEYINLEDVLKTKILSERLVAYDSYKDNIARTFFGTPPRPATPLPVGSTVVALIILRHKDKLYLVACRSPEGQIVPVGSRQSQGDTECHTWRELAMRAFGLKHPQTPQDVVPVAEVDGVRVFVLSPRMLPAAHDHELFKEENRVDNMFMHDNRIAFFIPESRLGDEKDVSKKKRKHGKMDAGNSTPTLDRYVSTLPLPDKWESSLCWAVARCVVDGNYFPEIRGLKWLTPPTQGLLGQPRAIHDCYDRQKAGTCFYFIERGAEPKIIGPFIILHILNMRSSGVRYNLMMLTTGDHVEYRVGSEIYNWTAKKSMGTSSGFQIHVLLEREVQLLLTGEMKQRGAKLVSAFKDTHKDELWLCEFWEPEVATGAEKQIPADKKKEDAEQKKWGCDPQYMEGVEMAEQLGTAESCDCFKFELDGKTFECGVRWRGLIPFGPDETEYERVRKMWRDNCSKRVRVTHEKGKGPSKYGIVFTVFSFEFL